MVCLGLTAAFGLAFLVVKGFEYREDIEQHLVPGPTFGLHPPATQLFFSFYWAVTVTHAIHLSIGIVAVLRLAIDVSRDRLALRSPQYEVTALYWHLVDVIWIILYPLLYLGGRALMTSNSAETRVAAHERRIARALLAAWWSNLAIWAVLLVLLFASMGLAYLPLGIWNFPVGIAIALIKAGLVVWFFMQIGRAGALTRLTAASAFVFIASMFTFTLADPLHPVLRWGPSTL